MKILIYGAGALGSLLAARLYQSGQQVSLLARGQRLQDLRRDGLIVEDSFTHERLSCPITLVDHLKPDEYYDWVIPVMGSQYYPEIIPALAANHESPNYLFLGNNVAGGRDLAESLGRDRVMFGFLMASGKISGAIASVANEFGDRRPRSVLGEMDGSLTNRLIEIAAVLENAGFPVEISHHIEAWLKTHAAIILPMAGAYYLAGSSQERMANTRDIQVMLVRGIREAFQVLRIYHMPITPAKLSLFSYLPEPLLVGLAGRIFQNPLLGHSLSHADGMRQEVSKLGREFNILACNAGVVMPHFDHLILAARSDARCLPEGSSSLTLDWSEVMLATAVIAATFGILYTFPRFKARRRSKAR
jgi:2-dehydropantoate 2-reductase